MITHLPADIELTFSYRALSAKVGEVKAAYIFHRLWTDLAYQARAHGRCGTYELCAMERFLDAVEDKCDVEDSIKLLIECGLLKRVGNDAFCAIFFHYNAHLDGSYIPPTTQWAQQYQYMVEEIQKRMTNLSTKIPKLAWYLTTGEVISEPAMNRAAMLIHMLDIILRRKSGSGIERPRKPEEMEIGILQASCSVVAKYSDAKLNVFTRRLMAVSRPRLNPLFPATTEEALAKFDDMIVMLMPDEGFESWIKRIEHPNEEEATRESTTREILDQISRISDT